MYVITNSLHLVGFLGIFAGFLVINLISFSKNEFGNQAMILIGFVAIALCLAYPVRLSIAIFGFKSNTKVQPSQQLPEKPIV